jgi:hypothetical protein
MKQIRLNNMLLPSKYNNKFNKFALRISMKTLKQQVCSEHVHSKTLVYKLSCCNQAITSNNSIAVLFFHDAPKALKYLTADTK